MRTIFTTLTGLVVLAVLTPTMAQGLSFTAISPLRDDIVSLEGLLVAILNILLVIAVPIIVFFIIMAGFKYVTAQGNAEQIKAANRSLTYAIIGAILILGGVALSEILKSVACSFSDNPTACMSGTSSSAGGG